MNKFLNDSYNKRFNESLQKAIEIINSSSKSSKQIYCGTSVSKTELKSLREYIDTAQSREQIEYDTGRVVKRVSIVGAHIKIEFK